MTIPEIKDSIERPPQAVFDRLAKFAATKELSAFTDLEVRDLLAYVASLEKRNAQ